MKPSKIIIENFVHFVLCSCCAIAGQLYRTPLFVNAQLFILAGMPMPPKNKHRFPFLVAAVPACNFTTFHIDCSAFPSQRLENRIPFKNAENSLFVVIPKKYGKIFLSNIIHKVRQPLYRDCRIICSYISFISLTARSGQILDFSAPEYHIFAASDSLAEDLREQSIDESYDL